MSIADDLARDVRYRAAEIAGNARETLERELKRAAPVGTPSPYQTHEPGQLRDSVAVNVRFDQVVFTFTAQVPVEYASFTNDGTPSHFIVGVRSPKRVLRFDWPKQGLYPAFIRGVGGFPAVVNHPGTARTGWWDSTVARWQDMLQAAQ